MQPLVVIYDVPGVRTITVSKGWQASFEPISLNIQLGDWNVIVSWSTNFTGLALQSSSNLVSPVWATVSATSVDINGQNTVTNPISGTPLYYRLKQ
jgi:hypothetical protein